MMARKTTRSLWTHFINNNTSPSHSLPNSNFCKPLGKSRQLKSLSSRSTFKSINTEGLREPFHGIILGIDPSLRGTGLAVIDFKSNQSMILLESKTVRLKKNLDFHACLGIIYLEVASIIDSWPIMHVAIEQTIYVQNFQTAQILGAARGVAIAAASVAKLPVFEYPPLRVKQAISGFGRASKDQVKNLVENLLQVKSGLPHDESDAGGVAICHAFTWQKRQPT